MDKKATNKRKSNVVRRGKNNSRKLSISNNTKKKLLCCGLVGSLLGGAILFNFGKKSNAANDAFLTASNGKLYLVDVIDEDSSINITDIDGNNIPYNFDSDVLAIVGADKAKTYADNKYEVMLVDKDNNITYGLMDGKYLSNHKIDSVKVLTNDFCSYKVSSDCHLFEKTSTDSSSYTLDSNQNLVASSDTFQSVGNDYLWNEAISICNGEIKHGYVINDSIDHSLNSQGVSSSYFVTVVGLNLRSSASTDSNVITTLSKNDEVIICDDVEPFEDGRYRWVYVSYTDGNGNVNKGWVAEVDYSGETPIKLISNNISEISVSPNDLYSECAILYDITDNKVLFDKNASQQMRPASITKILTAYLVSKYGDLDDKLVYSSSAVNVEGHYAEQYGTTSKSPVFHVVQDGNCISVRDALHISLLLSDNATTVALKEYVENKTGKDFEKLMNQTAVELGCTNSNFTNPYGYEDDDHLVTAHDMAMIAAGIARDAKDVLEIMGTDSYKLEYDGTVINHQSVIVNKNAIENNGYYSQYAVGCKTGWIKQSGHTMVSIYEKDGHTYAIVSLNGQYGNSKNEDARLLSDYAFSLQKNKGNKSLVKKIF